VPEAHVRVRQPVKGPLRGLRVVGDGNKAPHQVHVLRRCRTPGRRLGPCTRVRRRAHAEPRRGGTSAHGPGKRCQHPALAVAPPAEPHEQLRPVPVPGLHERAPHLIPIHDIPWLVRGTGQGIGGLRAMSRRGCIPSSCSATSCRSTTHAPWGPTVKAPIPGTLRSRDPKHEPMDAVRQGAGKGVHICSGTPEPARRSSPVNPRPAPASTLPATPGPHSPRAPA
jgi:hypothetical protein